MCSLKSSEYSNFKLAEATMGRGQAFRSSILNFIFYNVDLNQDKNNNPSLIKFLLINKIECAHAEVLFTRKIK
jgi:hypothetical protein